MNLNNLQDLQGEMRRLGFGDKLIEQMEEYMKKDVRDFKLYDTVPANTGQVDIAIHFKQSGQSEFYYLNKYEAAYNQGRPLEEGQKYMVITPNEEGKNMVKKFENVTEAITFFKAQKGNSELAAGKDAAHKNMLSNMENGKINFVARDFQRSFYSQPMPQTFWVDRGKGFTREQGANLVQGRAVYRDDMLSRAGVPYKAWMVLDTEKPRDKHGNLEFRQFASPNYRFDLSERLNDFTIKGLEDPKKAELIENSLKNGNRTMVTVTKDGEQQRMFVETSVRWGKLNFYAENGRPEKREQYLKEPVMENNLLNGKDKGKEKEMAEMQGLAR